MLIPQAVVQSSGAGNFTLITDSLLAVDTASFDFTSIPGTYKHLQILMQIRSAKAASTSDNVRMRYNNDSSAIYDTEQASVSGGSYVGLNSSGQTSFNHLGVAPAASSPSGSACSMRIDIVNYAATTFRKNFLTEWILTRADDSADIVRGFHGGTWRSTSALTQVTIFFAADNVLAGSRATLYGMS